MKPIASALAAILLVSGGGLVVAQTVVIQPEQETVVREYIKKKPVAFTLRGVELNIGSTLDEKVELHPMEVPDMKYRYVVIDNRTYLVEPESRKIVHIIQ